MKVNRYSTALFLVILMALSTVVYSDKAVNQISETFDFEMEKEIKQANSSLPSQTIPNKKLTNLTKIVKNTKGNAILNSLPKKKKTKAQPKCNCNECKQCKKCNIDKSSQQVGNTYAHSHTHSEFIDDISMLLYKYLYKFFMNYPKEIHHYLACGIISFIPIPILIIMMAFGINNPLMLNLLTAFSLGALLGDVIFHNIVHIIATKSIFVIKDITIMGFINLDFLFEKEMFIIHGVILMIFIEKLFQQGHSHSHEHEHKEECKEKDKNVKPIENETTKSQSKQAVKSEIITKKKEIEDLHISKSTIIIAFMNDFVHNFTDGIAIASLFRISTKMGISSLVAMILHEIPHELADFSFLLKKKKSIFYCLFDQLLAASGAFLGVFLSSYIDDKYSLHMLSLISGMFLYFCLNTLANEIKEKSHIIVSILQLILLILGVHLMKTLI